MASEQVQVTAQVADGFEDLFYPIVKECDEHVRSVVASQELLAVQIDRLGNGTHIARRRRCTAVRPSRRPALPARPLFAR